MSVTIRWGNPNPVGGLEDEVKIYRATSPMDPGALPTALDTLAAGVTLYVDSSAVDTTLYYYRVGYVRGAEEMVSDEISVVAPTGSTASPGIAFPPMSASTGILMDETGLNLYSTSSSDKPANDWFSIRKLLASMVIMQEKAAVLDSELVTITTADITGIAAEFLSGLANGDQITWESIIKIMLVPSKSDVAGTVTRVLGAELQTKYGIGEDATRAMGYWMGVSAVRCGAPNCIAITNTAVTSVSGEVITSQLAASPRSIALMLRQALRDSTLAGFMDDRTISVEVFGPSPRTLNFRAIDRLRDVLDAADVPTNTTYPGYIAGKTGDGTSLNQAFTLTAPSGSIVLGSIKGSTSYFTRAQDLRRIMMAAETQIPSLRTPETTADPDASSVSIRVRSNFPPTDSSPVGRTVTNTGVTQTSSLYMDGTMLVFDGSDYLTLSGTPPALGSADFTAELFLEGQIGASPGATMDVFGQYRATTAGRSWAFQISSTAVTFFYSTTGTDFFSVAFTIDRAFLLNGAPTHIVAQRTGTSLVLFINGQPSAVHNIGAAVIFTPPATAMMVGARISAGAVPENFYTGRVHEAIMTPGVARYPLTGFRSCFRSMRWG